MDFAAIRFHIRTIKPVAKSGVTRFRIGTEASAAMINPHKSTVTRFAFSDPFCLGPAHMTHGGEFEILPAEQIAIAHVERDEIHTRNEK